MCCNHWVVGSENWDNKKIVGRQREKLEDKRIPRVWTWLVSKLQPKLYWDSSTDCAPTLILQSLIEYIFDPLQAFHWRLESASEPGSYKVDCDQLYSLQNLYLWSALIAMSGRSTDKLSYNLARRGSNCNFLQTSSCPAYRCDYKGACGCRLQLWSLAKTRFLCQRLVSCQDDRLTRLPVTVRNTDFFLIFN